MALSGTTGLRGPCSVTRNAGPDEEVELEVVHVAGGAGLRTVQGQVEHVTVVVQPGDVVATQRVASGLGVHPEVVGEQLGRGVVGLGDVDPHPPVVAHEQGGEVRGLGPLGHPRATVDPHHADVGHGATVGAGGDHW